MPEHVMLAVLIGLALAITIPFAVAILRDWNPNPHLSAELIEQDERDIEALADAVFSDDRAAKILVAEAQILGRHRAGLRQATIGPDWIGAPRKAAHR